MFIKVKSELHVYLNQIYSQWRLEQQTVGLKHSWSLASKTVGQLVDVDQTTSSPAGCSWHLSFKMDLTVKSVYTSTPWSMFQSIKGLLQDYLLYEGRDISQKEVSISI